MFRIPHVVIDAVHDAGDGAMAAQESIQTKSIFRCLNLARVAPADGADGVAPGDARLEEINAAEELQLIWIEELRIQCDLRQNRRGEEALIAEIVNGEQGLDAHESWVAPKVFADVDGRERGLPVMQVQ